MYGIPHHNVPCTTPEERKERKRKERNEILAKRKTKS
jgi:hypothetical protein